MTLRTKILAIAAMLCATAFYAGCDDSSSSPAAPAPTPTEGEFSSSSVQAQEPLPTSSEPAETAEPESSSSVESDPLAESSSSEPQAEIPVEEECYDGGASIELRNIERINFSCPNSMTMYSYDLWTLFKCDDRGNIVEIEMPPCGM